MPDSAAALRKLDDVAVADPSLQPYAELLARALESAADPAWAEGVADLPAEAAARLGAGEPVLHGARLRAPGLEPSDTIDAALNLEPLEGPEATRAQLGLLPLLMAAGAACAPAVAGSGWQLGICPICAAWPALAESRGIDRPRVMRCGRCGSEWKLPWQLCPFCANADHATLSYLVSDTLGEAKRVFVCERCHGFLKTIATIAPIDSLAVPVEDLATLELDLVAIDAGFQRPAEPGFHLRAHIAPR
jgi:hypothetical protein